MKIAVIDDRRDERQCGRLAVMMADHEAVVIDPTLSVSHQFPAVAAGLSGSQKCLEAVLKNVDAIVTDLYYSWIPSGDKRYNDHVPGGLLTVILAKHLGIPIVICTACGDHHTDQDVNWIYDSGILRGCGVPFVEDKDWDQAVREVTQLVMPAK